MKRILSFAVLVLMVGPWCSAAPLDRTHLPADAKWFVHLDLDAARSSAIGKLIRDAWLSQARNKGSLTQFRDTTGTDPLQDLHDITAFNTAFEKNVSVLLVRGKIDKDRLMGLTGILQDHEVATHGKHEVHTWTDANSGKKSAGAIYGKDMLVIGPGAEAVKNALDVLDGKAPSLGAQQADAPAAGTLVQAAASGLSDAQDLPGDPAVRKDLDRASLSLADHEGQTSLNLQVITKSADAAAKLRAMLDGLRAFAQMQHQNDAELTKVLGAIKISSDEKTVLLEWQARTAEVLDGIQQFAARAGHPIEPDQAKP